MRSDACACEIHSNAQHEFEFTRQSVRASCVWHRTLGRGCVLSALGVGHIGLVHRAPIFASGLSHLSRCTVHWQQQPIVACHRSCHQQARGRECAAQVAAAHRRWPYRRGGAPAHDAFRLFALVPASKDLTSADTLRAARLRSGGAAARRGPTGAMIWPLLLAGLCAAARATPHLALHARERQGISHIIHQSWKDENVPADYQRWTRTWREKHPDWEYWRAPLRVQRCAGRKATPRSPCCSAPQAVDRCRQRCAGQ